MRSRHLQLGLAMGATALLLCGSTLQAQGPKGACQGGACAAHQSQAKGAIPQMQHAHKGQPQHPQQSYSQANLYPQQYYPQYPGYPQYPVMNPYPQQKYPLAYPYPQQQYPLTNPYPQQAYLQQPINTPVSDAQPAMAPIKTPQESAMSPVSVSQQPLQDLMPVSQPRPRVSQAPSEASIQRTFSEVLAQLPEVAPVPPRKREPVPPASGQSAEVRPSGMTRGGVIGGALLAALGVTLVGGGACFVVHAMRRPI